MPKVFAERHDDFMKAYFKSNDSKIIGKDRFVMGINKDGFLVPCSLMLKVLP